jgi:hypothetical protein
MMASPGFRRIRVLAFAISLLFGVGLSALYAEAAPTADLLTLPDEEKPENPLLRLEIVSLGSYPITLFYVGFIYDIKRYYENGKDAAYAPWPFRGTNAVALDNSERMARLEAALCLSFAVGIVDAAIHASKVKKAKRLREARTWASAPSPMGDASKP